MENVSISHFQLNKSRNRARLESLEKYSKYSLFFEGNTMLWIYVSSVSALHLEVLFHLLWVKWKILLTFKNGCVSFLSSLPTFKLNYPFELLEIIMLDLNAVLLGKLRLNINYVHRSSSYSLMVKTSKNLISVSKWKTIFFFALERLQLHDNW